MNLAWGAIVLVVLLLPGFLFFVGLYAPERFARQLAERSPLGQLAGIVLASLAVHAVLYAIVQSSCTTACIRVENLIELITLSNASHGQIIALVPAISDHVLAIAGYTLIATTMGFLLGVMTGALIVSGWLRFLSQHVSATRFLGRIALPCSGFGGSSWSLQGAWLALECLPDDPDSPLDAVFKVFRIVE